MKGRFAELLLPICKLSMASNQNETVGVELAVLGHLINDKKIKVDEILGDLMDGGLLDFLVECAPIVPKINRS